MARAVGLVRPLVVVAILGSLSLASACGGDSTGPGETQNPQNPQGPTASAIALVSGDGQSATASAAFAQPLVVRVTDASGSGLAGATVSFQVTSGSGSVGSASVATASGGLAQTTATAGSAAGALVVTASVSGVSQTVSFRLTVQSSGGGGGGSAGVGRWVGTTSQNRAITLWVGSASLIDSLRVAVAVDVGIGTCTVTYTPAAITVGAGGAFTAPLNSPSLLTGTLTGTFGAASVSGTFQAAWNGVLICGSTVTIGVGGSSASGTWTATRSPLGVTSVTPNSGPLAGGTAVTITGWFESNVDSVRIGTTRVANLTRTSITELRGTTGAAATSGSATVTVFSGGTNSSCTSCFTYNPLPTITTVSPNSASIFGGTTVTITGTGFPATIDSVRMGGVRMLNVVRNFSSQITAVTPSVTTAGPVDVTVFSSTAGNGGCTGCFTFNPPGQLTVSSVTPNNGPLAGGLAVTVRGTEFPPNIDSVRVGTARLANLVRVSGTQITGTTPAATAAGSVAVTVYSSTGSAACNACFTYNAAMTVTGISPASGSVDGRLPVTITGTNFPTTVDSVRFGSARITNLSRVSSTQITGNTPSGAGLGQVTVTVYASSTGSASCNGCYSYTPPATFASVIAGGFHSCGQITTGAAYCWGSSASGQLGDGTTTSRNAPMLVTGGVAFASLIPGSSHTCALTNAGAAYCWGENFSGRLGDGTQTNRSAPVAVTGGLTFASVTAGGSHTCGLTGAGVAYCWGLNQSGQLGDGTTANRTAPTPVGGGLTFTALSAGSSHTCGLTGSGTAYCWGSNSSGQRGDTAQAIRTTPGEVSGGLTFARISAGETHSCALTAAGAAYCWGSNGSGRLGDGTTTNRNSPVAVSGGLSFGRIAAGGSHSCALTNAGAVYCWGSNGSGQIGDDTSLNRSAPVAVSGGHTFTSISVGSAHSCALRSGGTGYCWGSNGSGRLGDGTSTSRDIPTAVASP